MPSRVVAVILNWNNASDTLACLESLSLQDYPHRVLVVDNGSEDDSVARLSCAYPGLEILETRENLGYAGGNNAGIRRALAYRATHVLILNNDATLSPDCLTKLMQAAETVDRVGVVGGTILDAESPERVQSAGMMLDRMGDAVHRSVGKPISEAPAGILKVDAVKGCAMLVTAAAIRAAGLLDERYYMYREEVDWCLRIRHAGYSVVVDTSAHVWHAETAEGDDRYVRATYYMTRNGYLLLMTMQASVVVYCARLCRDLVWAANWTVNPRRRAKRRDRNAIAYALEDALRSRWGRMAESRAASLGLP